ncbi:MAG: hypothetical protein RLZZ488_2652 [Pseudomonadota bacterium]
MILRLASVSRNSHGVRSTDACVRSGSKQVKIHGVIPKEQACTADEARIDETSYIPEVNASGGVWVDSCDSTINYESVVNQIFNEAKKLPAFILKADKVKNVSVKVNGEASSNFRIIGSNSVEVNGLSNSGTYIVEISYSKPE